MQNSTQLTPREHFHGSDLEKIEKIYMTCSVLRLAAFSLVIEFGVMLYYLLNDTIGLYIAAIGAICSMFTVPTKAGIEHETGYFD